MNPTAPRLTAGRRFSCTALPPAPPSMPSGYALPLGDAYGSARQARSGMRSPLRASLFCDTESSSPEGSVARGSARQRLTSRGKGALCIGTEGGRSLFCRKAFQGFGGRGWERIVFAKAIPCFRDAGNGKSLNHPKLFPVSGGEGMESIRILQNHSQELKRRGGRSKGFSKSIP